MTTTLPISMQAWQLPVLDLARLQLQDVPVPTPGPNQLLVRSRAVSLNFRDKLVAIGVLPSPGMTLPFVPASDMAGEVVAVGDKVTRFAPGARVTTLFHTRWLDADDTKPVPPFSEIGPDLGGSLPGVLAEYVLLDEQAAVATPAYMSDAEAATLPIAALTAWTGLVERGQLRPGASVLVHGTGGVALFAVQIAHAVGARVIVVTSSDEKAARAKTLGADITINRSHTPDWVAAVLEATQGRGADYVLEVVGGTNLGKSVAALAPGGLIVLVGLMESLTGEFPIGPLLLKRGRIEGITVGHRRGFEEMNRFLAQHQIHPVIDTEYLFTAVSQAFAHLDRGAFGKVVIKVA